MNYLKLYENFKHSKPLGIHCSPKDIVDDYSGIITDEYHGLYPIVLDAIKKDYKYANNYIEQIQSLDNGLNVEQDDAIELVFEIESFFTDNNLEWIFVSNTEPLTNYGENCYTVYFKNMNGVYSVMDELVDNATIYIYDTTKNKPILKKQ